MTARTASMPWSPLFSAWHATLCPWPCSHLPPLQGQAVAVKQGGVVAKEAVAAATAAAAREGAAMAPPRLCVEDPLTGRDVAGGTNRIAQVRQAASAGVLHYGDGRALCGLLQQGCLQLAASLLLTCPSPFAAGPCLPPLLTPSAGPRRVQRRRQQARAAAEAGGAAARWLPSFPF